MTEWHTVKISEDVWRMLKVVSASGVSIQAYASDALRQSIREDFPELYKRALSNTEWLALRTSSRNLRDLHPLEAGTPAPAPDVAPELPLAPPAPVRKSRGKTRG